MNILFEKQNYNSIIWISQSYTISLILRFGDDMVCQILCHLRLAEEINVVAMGNRVGELGADGCESHTGHVV